MNKNQILFAFAVAASVLPNAQAYEVDTHA